MSRSNQSWTWSTSSVWISKMIVDETGEVHKSSHSQMFCEIGALKSFAIFTRKHLRWRLQYRCFLENVAKFLRTAFYKEHLRWSHLVAAINGIYSEVGVSNGILRHFRTATFENNFWGLSLERKQRRRRARSDPCNFRFSLFPGQLFIKSLERSSFSTNFRIAKPLCLDYVIHFNKPKMGLFL